MKSKQAFFICSLICSILAGCHDESSPTQGDIDIVPDLEISESAGVVAEGAGQKVFENSTVYTGEYYSMEFPEGWEIVEQKTDGGSLHIVGVSPLESDEDEYTEVVSVTHRILPEGFGGAEFLEVSKADLKKRFGEDVQVDFIPFESEYEESYALDIEAEVDGLTIPVKLYTIFQDSKVYIITLGILTETSEEMRNLIDQVVGTFRIRE